MFRSYPLNGRTEADVGQRRPWTAATTTTMWSRASRSGDACVEVASRAPPRATRFGGEYSRKSPFSGDTSI